MNTNLHCTHFIAFSTFPLTPPPPAPAAEAGEVCRGALNAHEGSVTVPWSALESTGLGPVMPKCLRRVFLFALWSDSEVDLVS